MTNKNKMSVIAIILIAVSLLMSACGTTTGKKLNSSAPVITASSTNVGVNEKVVVTVVAKTAGELHVHSTPEQHIEYAAGKSTHEFTFDVPGVIEVEDHKSGKGIEITVK